MAAAGFDASAVATGADAGRFGTSSSSELESQRSRFPMMNFKRCAKMGGELVSLSTINLLSKLNFGGVLGFLVISSTIRD